MNREIPSIFQNQPPTSYYNKSFEDAKDVFFLHLNEIEPHFINATRAEHAALDNAEDECLIRDPRNKQQITTHEYDYKEDNTALELFKSPVDSCLSLNQHTAGVRILLARQQCVDVEAHDWQTWCKMARFLQAERLRMHKFTQEYVHKYKTEIYQPAKRYVKLYQQWYANQVQRLMQQHANVAYNTTAGLPQVRLCTSFNNELRARVDCIQNLAQVGYVRVHEDWKINYKTLHEKLEIYAEKYRLQNVKTANFSQSAISKYWQELHTQNQLFNAEQQLTRCYLPLDTLLFLLLAGEFVDLPSEVLLRLEVTEDGFKCAKFEKPLPARNCGWHTHQQVVQQAHDMQLSLDGNMQWLVFKEGKLKLEEKRNLEIQAALNAEQGKKQYKVYEFEEYMQLLPAEAQQQHLAQTDLELKSNAALIAWQLQTFEETNADKTLSCTQMLTEMQLPAALSCAAQSFYGSSAIKLEYKPTMGCEVLTKYELLKHWWQLRLLETAAARQAAMQGLCTRLSADSFETLLLQQLNRGQLEQHLFEEHKIRMPQLLLKLHEFLLLLGNMPVGDYMLRFNPKYNDKLLLCAPTKEITANTVHLHNLLMVTPTDICFMTNDQLYLPLSETLCSKLHCKYNYMPCTFPPATCKRKQNKNVYFNDRKQILQHVKRKIQIVEKKKSDFKKKSKNIKRAKKRKINKTAKELEMKKAQEHEQDLQNDRILFGDI